MLMQLRVDTGCNEGSVVGASGSFFFRGWKVRGELPRELQIEGD